MQLRFFNRCYWPDSQATGQLLTELCEFLAIRHQVEVVVGQPHFPDRTTNYLQSGVSNRNGVVIARLRHQHQHQLKRFARVRSLVSFTWSTRKYLRGEPRSIQRSPPVGESSVWICETDPFLLPFVVGPEARRRGIPCVYYIQDIYPDVAVSLGVVRNNPAIRLLRNRLRNEYRQADKIVVLDEDMKTRLSGWGIHSDKISIIPNWMDCSSVQPIKQDNPFRSELGIDSRFVVMHSGNMGMTQRLDALVDATKNLPAESNIELLLIGDGVKSAELKDQAHGLSHVRFLPYQPRETLSESLSAANLHVISMDQSITGCLAPSKLYGILASGTPILAIVPKGNAVWRFVETNRLGWCAEPGNIDQIAQAMLAAASKPKSELFSMGMQGRSLAETLYDKQLCCGMFEQLLKDVGL
jgi:colanic acid biosynthesis glycosyl transferase WcaI